MPAPRNGGAIEVPEGPGSLAKKNHDVDVEDYPRDMVLVTRQTFASHRLGVAAEN
jgi:hypothetical protein